MTPRLAVTIAAAAVAAAALASPAAAVQPALSASQITSPSDPAYAFGEPGSPAHALTIAGSTTGLPGQNIDINCYDGAGNASPVKKNITTAGNSFSVYVTAGDMSDASATNACVLRAVPAGDSSARPPSNSGDPYQGPHLSITAGEPTFDSPTGQAYDFAYHKTGTQGAFQFNSAEIGIPNSYLFKPSSLAPTDPLIWAANGFNGGELIKVDGVDSYVPDSAVSPGSSWFGIADIHTSLDPATGDFVLQDREPLSKASDPWNGSYVPSGVELDRTWTSDGRGQVAHLVDTWRSTDGQSHTIQLHYESAFATASAGNTLNFPGTSGYHNYAANDSVALPSGPGTVYFKRDGSTPDAGDGTNPQGAVTYAQAPDAPASIEFSSTNAITWLLPYNRTIPGGGSTTLRFTWSQGFALGDLQSFAQQALADYSTPQASTPPPPSGSITSNPLAGPPAPEARGAGLSLIGAIRKTGDGVSFTVACTNGPCPGGATLTTTELLKGSKLTGLTSAGIKRRKVTVGSTHFTIAGGAHKTITVKLNATGKKLLKKFKKLPAKLTVTLNGKAAIAKTATLKQQKRH